MKAADVPGLGLAVINDGKVMYLKGYGFRDVEKKLPYTSETVVSAASFTKVAFAYTVLQLVDRGLLDLDRPVFEYLPKPLPQYEKYADLADDERYRKITARMLLAHTSGLPNWRWFEDDRKLHIHFDPGTKFAYSGEGMDLLQLLVETVTKQPLDAWMQTAVFKPLGMSHSSMTWQPAFDGNFANGYDEYGRNLGPQQRKHADAAGSLLTTITDYAHFLQAFAEGRGLSPKLAKEALRPQIAINFKHEFPPFEMTPTEENKAIRLSYGLGVGLYWSPVGEAFFKEGHDDGWRNYFVYFTQAKSGMVLMTNSSNGEGLFKELLETVLKDTYTPIEWEGYTPYDKLPSRPPLPVHHQATISRKILDRYAGTYGTSPNPVLRIRVDGDHLVSEGDNEPVEEVLPETDTQFFSKSSDLVFNFEVDNEGNVTGVVVHVGRREISLKRAR
jgi:CubicO group peptidase (beta-lactamase class C family)